MGILSSQSLVVSFLSGSWKEEMTSIEILFLGPTYVAASVHDAASGVLAAFLIITHYPMLMGVAYASMARHARLFVAGLASLSVSVTYHVCRADIACLGVPIDQWRRADHSFVLIVIGCLGLHLIMSVLAPKQFQFFFSVAGYLVFVIAILSVLTLPYTLLSGVIMFIYVIVIASIRLAVLCAPGGLCPCSPDYDNSGPDPRTVQGQRMNSWTILYSVIGILAAAVSLGCYFITGSELAEGVSHAIWHFSSGCALWALSASVSERTEYTLRNHSRKVDKAMYN
jgi:hypothetical protein